MLVNHANPIESQYRNTLDRCSRDGGGDLLGLSTSKLEWVETIRWDMLLSFSVRRLLLRLARVKVKKALKLAWFKKLGESQS